MYLEQLLRYTREGGEDPPPKLADLIALRIERLDADARRVLQAVAVLGDAARSAQLVALVPDMNDIGRYMTLLRQAGFVDVNGPEAGCSHPLIRDIVLTSTPAAVRSELHGRARRDFGVDDLQIPLEAHALHAYYANSSFEALMLLEQTADKALTRDDPEGAVRAFRLALEVARREMMRGELDDPLGAVIMFSCKLGDALTLAGKHHDAEGVLTEALGLAGPQAKERPRLLASLANVARGTGNAGQAYAHLDEALRLAEKSKQPDLVDTLEQIRQRWVAG
jgi:serine/threonine-protein kinase